MDICTCNCALRISANDNWLGMNSFVSRCFYNYFQLFCFLCSFFFLSNIYCFHYFHCFGESIIGARTILLISFYCFEWRTAYNSHKHRKHHQKLWVNTVFMNPLWSRTAVTFAYLSWFIIDFALVFTLFCCHLCAINHKTKATKSRILYIIYI